MTDSRRKGREAEREFEREVEARDIEVERNLGGRIQKTGDVRLPGVAVEVRRREKVAIVAWSREQEAKTPEHLIPAVAYRTNNEPWRVSMPLSDFLDLLEQSSA